jgi:ribose-phosphate pyrophosphokinase
VHKRRISGQEVQAQELIGNVEGRNVLMVDDMITTAGTVCTAAKLVRERGAKEIYIGATHGVFAPSAVEKLSKTTIDEIVVTDTIPLTPEAGKLKKIKVLTVSDMLGEAIKRIHRNESVSSLFS